MNISQRVDERVSAAGPLGLVLKRYLHAPTVEAFASLRFDEQISFVYRTTWVNAFRPSPVSRVALSFLCATVPVQVAFPSSSLFQILSMACRVPELPIKPEYSPQWLLNPGKTVKRFPLKANPAATNKVNLFLWEVGRDLSRLSRTAFATAAVHLDWLRRRKVVYNDQASAFLLYGYLLSREHDDGWRIAAQYFLDPAFASGASVFIKAVGANASLPGAMLAEGASLMGRDVKPVDLYAESAQRVSLRAVNDLVARYDDNTIRREVRLILEREIKRTEGSYRLEFPSLDDHWAQRWQWAVNGAHSGLVYKAHPDYRPILPGFDRIHRRAWLETVDHDPRPEWDGRTFVSASPKLEAGKTRAIFACDTVNYLAFEHLMATVEKNWRGERVILNPGKGGHLGMAERVRAARNRSGISLMLDYDDFNSHHALRTMDIVIDETCRLTGYPDDLRDKLIKSLYSEEIYVEGRFQGYVKGTLMSGHRCTTYFNSVLNEAYLAIVLGRQFLDQAHSLHVGDDVYLGVRNYQEVDRVITLIGKSRLRMNPAKQSVGHVSTEFLRVASDSRYSYGYLARAVASAVAGNWVNEQTLDPIEGLATILAAARALANRSGIADAPLLLFTSAKRITKLESKDDATLRGLLTGAIAANNGPNFQSSGRYTSVRIDLVDPDRDDFGYTLLPLFATRTYLATQASEIEIDALTRAGVSVEVDMARASYHKSAPRSHYNSGRLQVSGVVSTPTVGTEYAERLLRQSPPVGALTRFPLLVLARSRLPERIVRDVLAKVGGDPHTPWLDYHAWGEYPHGCVIATVMSYSDAASLGRRTACGVMTATHRCYV
uniref:RNA-directed RNA polymerase n=1 Tax=Phomopsis longicolla totivirus 1 TaxID=1708381 RepID=A0A0M4L074_9VIRU|nr:RNA-dependent RNA polymerase [Phomopsis longicolla totivirus 1]